MITPESTCTQKHLLTKQVGTQPPSTRGNFGLVVGSQSFSNPTVVVMVVVVAIVSLLILLPLSRLLARSSAR